MVPEKVEERIALREQFGTAVDSIYVTEILSPSIGYEVRTARMAGRPKFTFTAYGIDGGEMRTVRDFFLNRKGRLQGFLWNNPATSGDTWVRFAQDKLTIRRIAHDAFDYQISLIEYLPVLVPPYWALPPLPPPLIPRPPAQAGDPPLPPDFIDQEFPAYLTYGADVTIEFETIIVTGSGGAEWRQAKRWHPVWHVHVDVSPGEFALIDPSRVLYGNAGGRWKYFKAQVEGVMDMRTMRFASDVGEFSRPGPNSAGVDVDLISVPQRNAWPEAEA